MRGHIHTDAVTLLVTAVAVGLVFHAMRGGGAFLASHGASGIGNFIGGFATFPGSGT